MSAIKNKFNIFKELLDDTSLFRLVYIIDLFFCMVSFLQLAAFVFLIFIFIWGIRLVALNQRRYDTFFKMRFGLWVGAFIVVSTLPMIIFMSFATTYSLIMFLHILICFFIFYGMHTEPDFNFRAELNFIAGIIVYLTAILNFIGLLCLVFGIHFEWMWIKFIVYENRFTGLYINPNILGFISVVSLICCHILCKQKMIENRGGKAVNKVLIAASVIMNIISLILCDSNSSFVLAVGYVITYIVYMVFAQKRRITISGLILRIVSLLLTGIVIVSSSLLFRNVFQAGFSVVTAKTNNLVEVMFDNGQIIDDIESGKIEKTTPQKSKNRVTFDHQNKNIDSGRFKLWRESIELFKISPIIGISNGNITVYSEEYLSGALQLGYHNSDVHNGFLTILVSTGMIGFLLFCTFGFRFAKHAAQHLFWQKKSCRDDAYPCLFAFLFSYLFFAFFEKALLYDITIMVMWFWLIMGYTSCYIAALEPNLESQYLFHKSRLKRTLL